MNERDFALMKCACNDFVESYFKARPQLMRTTHEERLVEAGFTAAWSTRPAPAVAGEQEDANAVVRAFNTADGKELHDAARAIATPPAAVAVRDIALQRIQDFVWSKRPLFDSIVPWYRKDMDAAIAEALALYLAAPASPAATGPVPVLLPVVPTAPILGVLNEMLTNCHSVEESYADLRRAAAAPSVDGEG